MGGALAVVLPRYLLEWDFIKFPFWMFETTGQKPLPRRKGELIFVRQKSETPLVVFMYAK